MIKFLTLDFQVEIADLTEDAWAMRKQVWKREINEENNKLVNNDGNGNELHDANQKAEELVRKRMHELRHAQEIRQMYEVKMHRVNKMMKKVFQFLEEIQVCQTPLVTYKREIWGFRVLYKDWSSSISFSDPRARTRRPRTPCFR